MNVSKVNLPKSVSIHCFGDGKEGDEGFTKFGQQLIYLEDAKLNKNQPLDSGHVLYFIFFNHYHTKVCQPCYDLTLLIKNVFSYRRDGADITMLLLLQSSLRHADARLAAGGQCIPFLFLNCYNKSNILVVGEINLSNLNEKGAQTSYNIRL